MASLFRAYSTTRPSTTDIEPDSEPGTGPDTDSCNDQGLSNQRRSSTRQHESAVARERLLALMAQTERANEENPGPQRVVDAESAQPVESTASSNRAARLLQRLLPESLRNSRMDPGRAGFLGVALTACVAASLIAVSAWTTRPSAEPVPALPMVTPAAATPSTSAAPETLVISVVGRVHDPGLVRIEPGSRVADALKAAGGPLPGTNLRTLNLARELVDGEQLYVGVPIPANMRASTKQGQPHTQGSKININTAEQETLEELPGVGPVTAKRIMRWRSEHGPFDSVEQLLDVRGIGQATLSQLRDLVRV